MCDLARVRIPLIVGALAALVLPLAAHGQAIERNLPQRVEHGSSIIVTPVAPTDQDATPLGAEGKRPKRSLRHVRKGDIASLP